MGVYIHSDSGPNTSPALQSVYPITAGPVTIEDDVWIADRAVIMPGVTIGARSVIAANSLVTKNVPPGTLVGGTPARMLKQLVFPTDL
jgi:acetyltransferase-like isoleucine patch superfamily enzyme